MVANSNADQYVFGLDIGTRSVVGTVGYRESTNHFIVVAQVMKEHDTRAMLDGQIHDINKVAEKIALVKKELEGMTGCRLEDVCIAAAGRVLKTKQISAEFEFASETVINKEHIYSLDMLGVEKAYDMIREDTKNGNTKFYCVGYSVVRYFLNEYPISTLLDHKANKIGVEMIATFLPDEVVDGLYSAVEKAELRVANLTLEPIAAINVAIPEKFRLLNIALVDVGAGTSDISIAKDGAISAFGMMPFAGDEITETIAKKYLTDFETAEKVKQKLGKTKTVSFKDIMGMTHKVPSKEIIEATGDTVKFITKQVADKITDLNGSHPVSAVFIVGGGGKINGFDTYLAKDLGLPKERVALRGAEVLGEVEFLQPGIKKDSTLVTPIGICLNYYEQKNNFIYLNVNGERIKLYDNSKLTIMDAAMQIGLPNEYLFPRRGEPIVYTCNGKKKLVRGQQGEAAIVKKNGVVVGMNTKIESNDHIEIIESTVGENASLEISQLPEYHSDIHFIFNKKNIVCPKFVMVNGQLVSEYYSIKNNDKIEILDYYTLEQLLDFMDLDKEGEYLINNVSANLTDKVYENFNVTFQIPENYLSFTDNHVKSEVNENKEVLRTNSIFVTVNGEVVELKGKTKYILVDVLDFYPFDLSKIGGKRLVTSVNGVEQDFTKDLNDKDMIEIYWEA